MTAKEFMERWCVAEDWAQECIDLVMKARNPDRCVVGSEAETEEGALLLANAYSFRFDCCFDMAKVILGNDHLASRYQFIATE
jgi:hypothetical protein